MPPAFVFTALLMAATAVAPVAAACASTVSPDDTGATTTVWLIRHAEAGTGPDPALTPEGAARADGWHATLGAPALRRVYASDTRRARETAAAIAADAGVEVELYDPARPDDLIARLRTRAEPAVVVGHSNTLNPLAAALGAAGGLAPVAHTEHDRVYAMPLR